MQGGNLRADHRIIWSFVDVYLGPVSVVFGYVVIGENCFYRTYSVMSGMSTEKYHQCKLEDNG